MLLDVQQVGGQIGERRCQFSNTTAFKTLVVGGYAGILGDVAAQLLGQSPLRVVYRVAEELAMLQTAVGMFDVQRVLERDLLVGMGAVKGRHDGHHRLEIQMVDGVGEGGEKFAQSLLVNVWGVVQRAFHLHLLHRGQFNAGFGDVGERDDAVFLVFQLLVERTSVEVENAGFVGGDAALAGAVA